MKIDRALETGEVARLTDGSMLERRIDAEARAETFPAASRAHAYSWRVPAAPESDQVAGFTDVQPAASGPGVVGDCDTRKFLTPARSSVALRVIEICRPCV